jgi:hypothetical protein
MKKFFNERLLRERLLMLVFVAIGAVWWGSELITRVRGNVQAWSSLQADAEVQRLWLSQEATVTQRTAEVASRLDTGKTMNAAQAFAEVNRLAQGLSVEMGAQRTDRTDTFSLHSLQVTFRRVDMAGLLRFYEGVMSRAPYVGIDQCTISADRATPGMVNAVFRVYAVEAAKPEAGK